MDIFHEIFYAITSISAAVTAIVKVAEFIAGKYEKYKHERMEQEEKR